MVVGRRLIPLALIVVVALVLLGSPGRWAGVIGSAAPDPPPPAVQTESFSIRAGGFTGASVGIHPADILTAGPTVAIPCVNLGLICTNLVTGAEDELNALSYGLDFVSNPSLPPVEFSVGRGVSQGLLGTAVRIETTAPCTPAQAQADAFETALGLPGSNVQDLDGDGAACSTNAGFVLGLCEGFAGCAPMDDLDALEQDPSSVDPNADGTPDNAVFLALTPASPTLSEPGVDASDPAGNARAADILMTVGGGTPAVWADGATNLGLNEAGGDVIDAVCAKENGDGVYGTGDLVLFSLAPGSPTLASLSASAADLLRPGPAVSYPAARLGLQTVDNVDALKCPADDSDGDTFFDIADTCPTVPNPGQVDSDGDSYLDSIECHVGTGLGLFCSADTIANNEDPDARPTDFNDDRAVTGADLSAIAGVIGQLVPPAPVRRDIAPDPAGDNAIGGADLSRVAGVIGSAC